MKICLVTSGGDAQGMNTFIEAFCKSKYEVFGSLEGMKGLYENNFVKLKDTKGISSLGGTILKSSRFKGFFDSKDIQQQVINNLKENSFDYLIIIGGDGSKRCADILNESIKTIFVPATIDNDIEGFESIGFDTAVNNAMLAVDNISSTARSHNRDFVVEVMGNRNNSIANCLFKTGVVDILLTKESKLDKDFFARLENNNFNIIVVPEYAKDIDEVVSKIKSSGREVRKLVLGHIQRGGSPTARDRVLANIYAEKCIEMIEKGNKGPAII